MIEDDYKNDYKNVIEDDYKNDYKNDLMLWSSSRLSFPSLTSLVSVAFHCHYTRVSGIHPDVGAYPLCCRRGMVVECAYMEGRGSDELCTSLKALGPVPERPISVNPGLKFCSVFVFYIPMHCLG